MNGGLFTQAQNAVRETDISQARETIQLEILAEMMSKGEDMTEADVNAILGAHLSSGTAVIEGGKITFANLKTTRGNAFTLDSISLLATSPMIEITPNGSRNIEGLYVTVRSMNLSGGFEELRYLWKTDNIPLSATSGEWDAGNTAANGVVIPRTGGKIIEFLHVRVKDKNGKYITKVSDAFVFGWPSTEIGWATDINKTITQGESIFIPIAIPTLPSGSSGVIRMTFAIAGYGISSTYSTSYFINGKQVGTIPATGIRIDDEVSSTGILITTNNNVSLAEPMTIRGNFILTNGGMTLPPSDERTINIIVNPI